jgi:hypothetical protein
MYGRAIAILAAIPAIGSVATGCGASESSESSDSSTPPLTKAAFVKQGDAICEKVPSRYQARLKPLTKEQKQKSTPRKAAEEEANLKAAVPPLQTASAELGELSAPKGDDQQAEAIVAALEKGVDGLEESPGSELSGPKSPLAAFQKLTKEYGFKVCSRL